MLPAEICCVVGIDVAKSAHVVCALAAPSGAPRLKSTPIPATAEGVTVDKAGNIYGAEVGPRTVKKYVRTGS